MDLRLDLDTTTFEQFLEKGRSMIPGLAPAWTDHNIHDPGIMLIELIAFEAEAQTYALSRLRRDERLAYARLLGLDLRRPQPARALVWPPEDGDAAQRSHFDDITIEAGRRVSPDRPEAPGFMTETPLFLSAARLVRVETRFADGRRADHTRINSRNGATFLAFGPAPTAEDRLVLGFSGKLKAPADPRAALTLGVETWASGAVAAAGDSGRLRVFLIDDNGEQELEIRSDTTGGLLRSGVVALAPPERPQAGERFELALGAASGGFLRAPRLRRIAPNVVPVVQRMRQQEEGPGIGNSQPDQEYRLIETGWIADPLFAVSQPLGGGETASWTRVADFEASGPGDRHFVFDPAAGLIRFGNGINGAVLPEGATIQVEYFTSAGSAGNLPVGVDWVLDKLAGPYGSNGEVSAGGADADLLDDLRGEAQQLLVRGRPLVTAGDLEQAALALPDLGVARAVELAPESREPRGTRTLLVVGARDAEGGTAEPAVWREAIRQRLAERVPLGQRLRIIGPRYVDIGVRARLTVSPTADGAAVAAAAGQKLREMLVAVGPAAEDGWGFGRDVTVLAVKAWLRGIGGVAKVDAVSLSRAGKAVDRVVALGPTELPNLVLAPDWLSVATANGRPR